MNNYLNRYLKYLVDLTKSINIADTLKFIDNDDFDTEEVIEGFRSVINIDKICSLVNNNNFLKDFEREDKVEVFYEFFKNLHSYAKNLIKHFEIYSSKAITTSSFIMKGNIMLFPHYRRYMSTMLGYEYEATDKEWIMKENLTKDRRVKLAALSILTALGHRQMENMEEESCSGSNVTQSLLTEGSNNATISSPDKWVCECCTLINDAVNIKCAICYNEVEKVTNMPRINHMNDYDEVETENLVVVDYRMRNKENTWICDNCDFINDLKDVNCRTCFSDRRSNKDSELTRTITPSSLLQRRLKERNNSIEENNSLIEKMYINSLQRGRKPNFTQWKCQKCSCINDLKIGSCVACFQSRSLKESNLNDERIKVKSMEKPWKCEKCTFSNDIKQANCQVCFRGKSERTNPDDWKCRHCTYINVIANKECEVCKRRRTLVENTTSENVIIRKSTENVTKSPVRTSILKEERKWTCKTCTGINIERSLKCYICNCPRTSQSMHGERKKVPRNNSERNARTEVTKPQIRKIEGSKARNGNSGKDRLIVNKTTGNNARPHPHNNKGSLPADTKKKKKLLFSNLFCFNKVKD